MADAAEALVRLTVSHLALPTMSRKDTSRKITEVGLRYLGLSVEAATSEATT